MMFPVIVEIERAHHPGLPATARNRPDDPIALVRSVLAQKPRCRKQLADRHDGQYPKHNVEQDTSKYKPERHSNGQLNKRKFQQFEGRTSSTGKCGFTPLLQKL